MIKVGRCGGPMHQYLSTKRSSHIILGQKSNRLKCKKVSTHHTGHTSKGYHIIRWGICHNPHAVADPGFLRWRRGAYP